MTSNTAQKVFTQCSLRTAAAKPFLKWAGGKGQLLPQLLVRVPAKFETYFEPFIGGGALLFALGPKAAHISDVNAELINTYKVIQSDVNGLIRSLGKHRYEEEYFYNIRNADRSAAFRRWSPVRRASRLIFLNKTCFNGLYRVNSEGHFNTPFGRYTNPTILDSENLLACSAALKKVKISVGTFLEMEKRIKKNDFVYLDPPYAPLSTTAYFTGYSRGGFDIGMQRALSEFCLRLDKRGIRFMLSNSSAPTILELYKNFKIELVPANRAINSKSSKRGPVHEVIVRNY